MAGQCALKIASFTICTGFRRKKWSRGQGTSGGSHNLTMTGCPTRNQYVRLMKNSLKTGCRVGMSALVLPFDFLIWLFLRNDEETSKKGGKDGSSVTLQRMSIKTEEHDQSIVIGGIRSFMVLKGSLSPFENDTYGAKCQAGSKFKNWTVKFKFSGF